MELERKALESMFNDLQTEKRELKENYRLDLAEIENRQFQILDRFKRLDDWNREQIEKYQDLANDEAAATTEAIINDLEKMTPPPAFEAKQAAAVEKYEYKQVEPEHLIIKEQEPEPEPIPEPVPPANDYENGNYTGVKVGADKVKRYQLYYTCDNKRCRHKGKRYITPENIFVYCHECANKMKVKPATSQGFPKADSFNNFFIAGARITEEEIKAYSEPAARIEDVLTKYSQEQETFNKNNIRITPAKKEKAAPAAPAAKAPAAPAKKKAAAPAPAKKAPAAEQPRKTRVNEVIAAIEKLIEETGAMTVSEIEKALKKKYAWEWKSFYNMFQRGREIYPNNIIKDGRKYVTLRVRSEAKNYDGSDNAKPQAQTV